MEPADDIGPICFDEELFSGTRTRTRAVNTEGYVAKQDEPLWFTSAPATQFRSHEEKRKAMKIKLDYLYFQRDYAAVVELSTTMIEQETLKDNSLRKELIETKARALIHLNQFSVAATLLDQHREDFLTSKDLEQIWCTLRGSCDVGLGLYAQALPRYWRLACLSPEHVPCWMKLTEILLCKTPHDPLVTDLALLCALQLQTLLTRIAALASRRPVQQQTWPANYSPAVQTFLETSLAELKSRGAAQRDGLAQDWCQRARQANWDSTELQMITQCLLSDAAEPVEEDINPAGL